jgi:hypothetical protein
MGEPSLYETDILAWTEQQAAALRELASRRDLPNALDLANVIEEVEALGRTELRAATSPIRLILEHLVKLACDPGAPSAAHWVEEILHWHRDVQASISPSMHQRVDMDKLWRQARRDAVRALALHGVQAAPGLPEGCPLALEDFLADDFDHEAAITRVMAPVTGH